MRLIGAKNSKVSRAVHRNWQLNFNQRRRLFRAEGRGQPVGDMCPRDVTSSPVQLRSRRGWRCKLGHSNRRLKTWRGLWLSLWPASGPRQVISAIDFLSPVGGATLVMCRSAVAVAPLSPKIQSTFISIMNSFKLANQPPAVSQVAAIWTAARCRHLRVFLGETQRISENLWESQRISVPSSRFSKILCLILKDSWRFFVRILKNL